MPGSPRSALVTTTGAPKAAWAGGAVANTTAANAATAATTARVRRASATGTVHMSVLPATAIDRSRALHPSIRRMHCYPGAGNANASGPHAVRRRLRHRADRRVRGARLLLWAGDALAALDPGRPRHALRPDRVALDRLAHHLPGDHELLD